MVKKIPYGESNFEKIIKENYLYVDKTMYLKDLEKMSKLIYLRPRRFGKTLFTSLLDYYYGIDHADKFDELFTGLWVHSNPTENRHNYYVLKFNFSGTPLSSNINIEEVFNSKVISGVKAFVQRYNLNINLGDTRTPAATLLSLLNEFKQLKLSNKIYIVIDEYDHFTNTFLKGNAREFLENLQKGGFVRGFYEIIKEYAELGVVDRFFATGVMPVSLDSMTSGFNIATDISLDERFTAMTGFTEEETKKIIEDVLLKSQNREQIYQELKQNYDGYRFSLRNSEHVFNSTLVMYYMQEYLKADVAPVELVDRNVNTSGLAINNIIELINPEENYKMIEEIALNNEIVGKLVPYFELDKKFTRHDLISMLYHMGFLTIKSPGTFTKFKIPNQVMENVYLEYLLHALEKKKNYKLDISQLETAIMDLGEHGEVRPLMELVKETLTHFSNRDTQNFNEKNIKHTLATLLSFSNQFYIYGEFPANQGFADIMVQKTSGSYVEYETIIELKYLQKNKRKDTGIQELMEEGKNQLAGYLQDKRLSGRQKLKKYVIVFVGFDEYHIEEIL